MAVFLNILDRWEWAELNQEETAELLGVSERTFRRWTRRYEEEGEAGLMDRRLGKASGKRVPVDRAEEVERLYRAVAARTFHMDAAHLVRRQPQHLGDRGPVRIDALGVGPDGDDAVHELRHRAGRPDRAMRLIGTRIACLEGRLPRAWQPDDCRGFSGLARVERRGRQRDCHGSAASPSRPIPPRRPASAWP